MKRFSAVCVLALVIQAVVASASSAGDTGRVPNVYKGRQTDSRREVLSFWTEGRMQRATPFTPKLDLADLSAGMPSSLDATGSPRVVAPSAPARSFGATALSSGQIPYESQEISDTTTFPNSTHGKVFFKMGGALYVCSGTALNSANESVVWTAGHCVFDPDTGRFATNWMFIPGYRLGSAPYGRWTAQDLYTTTGWAEGANFEFDLGAAVVGPLNGSTIGDAVGGRGISFNLPRQQNFEAYGYPAAPPFDGERAYRCDSATGMSATAGPGPDLLGIGCDMKQGSSGGGWVVNSSTVASVVSVGTDSLPEVVFGPYQGSAAEQLFDEASGTQGPPDGGADPVTHRMKLTMRFSGALVISGKLSATDGYSACARGAAVGIFKRARTGFKLIKVVTTNDRGAYRAKVRNRKGIYGAYSPEGVVDDLNLCAEAASKARKYS